MMHSVGPKLSTLVVDGNLDMGAYVLKTDHIAESTAGNGIITDHGIGTKANKKLAASNNVLQELAGTYFYSGNGGTTSRQGGILWICPVGKYGAAGSVRVKATLAIDGGTITWTLYKNGASQVAWNSAGAKTQDVDVSPGDVLHLGAVTGAGGYGYLGTISICADEVAV